MPPSLGKVLGISVSIIRMLRSRAVCLFLLSLSSSGSILINIPNFLRILKRSRYKSFNFSSCLYLFKGSVSILESPEGSKPFSFSSSCISAYFGLSFARVDVILALSFSFSDFISAADLAAGFLVFLAA